MAIRVLTLSKRKAPSLGKLTWQEYRDEREQGTDERLRRKGENAEKDGLAGGKARVSEDS